MGLGSHGALGDPMGALGGPWGPSGALGDPMGALGGPRGPSGALGRSWQSVKWLKIDSESSK